MTDFRALCEELLADYDRANYRYPEENRTVFCGTYKTAKQAHYAAIAHKLENYWRP